MNLNLALWIAAGLLAAVLLVSTSKMFVPREKIAAVGHAAEWVLDFSPAALRAIGILEILGAAGLILPAALDIAPILVPVTATCVALLFTGAATMRLRRGEKATIVPDLVYLALAVFVAWGRFGPERFTS
jgi:DoxX-like family